MALWWHIPTVLGAMTIGGASLLGVTRDNWEPRAPTKLNRSVWETLDENSANNPNYKALQERARERDFPTVIMRVGDRVKRFISPGSSGNNGAARSAPRKSAPRELQPREYSWNYPWKRELNSPYSQSQYARRNNQNTNNRTTRQTAARDTTTRRSTTNQRAVASQSNTRSSIWQRNNRNVQTTTRSNTWQQNDPALRNSTQYASNSPAPPLPANNRSVAGASLGANPGYQIVIDTNGGMQEASLIERQLRQSGFHKIEKWQKAGDRKVRIHVGERMDQKRSDAEFAKLAKTLRTFTFYSEVTLQQL